MNVNRIVMLATLAAVLAAAGCSRTSDDAATVSEDALAARVNDWTLTREAFEEIMRRMPEGQRRRFETPQGQAQLAELLMQEEIAYREALKLKLSDKEEVSKRIEEATRTILVASYLADQVDTKARPTDEEIHEYYETHQDQYTTLETLRAQHVFAKSKEKLDDIKKRVEEGGEKFTTMAHLYSEDSITKADGGDLGYFNPGGYIRGVGFSKTFTDAVLEMEIGKLYGPIKWEQGYSLVRVSERKPAELRPYDEVKEDIAGRLSREKIENVRAAHFREVGAKYDTRNFIGEMVESTNRSPEELFNFAQSAQNPRQRIDAFQQIVDQFPDDPNAPKALFMIGFVYAEELKDVVSADHAFNQLIAKYPETEMASTARWMLDNLDKPMPKFDDLDDLNRQIEEKSD